MKRVLIVDDQADIRELVRMTLELQDYDLHEASNGEDGVKQAQALNPDLVLMDVMMPGAIDGIDALAQLARNPPPRFAFHSDAVVAPKRTIEGSGPGVLMEVARMLDEAGK